MASGGGLHRDPWERIRGLPDPALTGVFLALFEDLNAFNEEKNTPLHWACLNGHLEVVKKLILAGADVSVLNSYERTPMDEAVTRGKMDVIDAINTAVAQVELTGIRVS
ncbi:Ankyrin repeat-containing protein P16F5.05c [Morella rubra]|uniref:Ankyrin repeat-containing protein P16F5.05c n=1 Tax=Morella rubra TaxID=262757 RepID=A0A6A1WZM1_9ROSI|nr:Ankyrin repeat-containing protein P16F5.05c [Morella rubra]